MYLAKTAPDTVVRIYNAGGTVFIKGNHVLWAERAADATAFAPVSKNDLIV
jgi:hypothetical protein